MRMWMTDPAKMCRKHLLGEHVECHMFLGTIKRKKSVKGYLEGNLFEPLSLRIRHDELAAEMVRRGFEHKSWLEVELYDPDHLTWEELNTKIDRKNAQADLISRCADCKQKFEGKK